jgi:DNA-binding transcriptional MerR regulator
MNIPIFLLALIFSNCNKTCHTIDYYETKSLSQHFSETNNNQLYSQENLSQ